MGLYRNQKKMTICILLSIATLISFSCGCIESKDDTPLESSDNTEKILGKWSMIDEAYNGSFKIVYSFYENNSFFTGIQNISSNNYDFSLWGTYSLSNSRINLTTSEQNSSSHLKYSLSSDGGILMLYYEDEINFDVLTREK